MYRSAIALTLAAATWAAPAFANDSAAALATGGLVFVRNDDIEMRSEDLYISTAEIRVRYRFHNRSERDVSLLVAFPLPEITVDEEDAEVSVPTDDPVNFVGFKTTVNGRPVAADVEQRVFAAGVDRTEHLRTLGIPLAPHLEATRVALDRLPKARWDELIKLGLATIFEYDAGKGMERHLSPRWTLRTTFHWQQTFPAGAETVIDHRYRPSVGGAAQTALGMPGLSKEEWFAEYQRKYCIDRDFLAAVERLRRNTRSDTGLPYSEKWIDYILTTGANWSGPIKEFRLVVDKGAAGSLVSFCGEGVRKIGPTQFEMRKTDFVPRQDLSVLILEKMGQ